jgi:hypothetical protein
MSLIKFLLKFLLQKSVVRQLIRRDLFLLALLIWTFEKLMPGFLDDWLGYHLYCVFLEDAGERPAPTPLDPVM